MPSKDIDLKNSLVQQSDLLFFFLSHKFSKETLMIHLLNNTTDV
jgi:hypothetical protein